jgi:diguanylate cyclase (GGDEF)-like protein/PAS domain S-box-containing protein
MHPSVIAGFGRGDDENGLRARWLLDAMCGVVGVLSPRGTVLDLNRAGLECASLSRGQAVGRKLWELEGWYGSDGARRRSHQAVARAARGKKARLGLSLHDATGRVRTFDIVLTPVHNRRGNIAFLVLEGHNVTDLRSADGAIVRQNAELQNLADRLAAADARRRRFITDISHELKTPLSIATGLLDRVLNGSVLPPPDRRDILAASRHAESIQVQIDDLLTVARIEAGRFELARVPCDLADLTRRTAAGFESLAAAQYVSLAVRTPPSVVVVADPQRITSVISNLVSNALKATPPGGRVGVELREWRGNACLEVSDTGPGVPARLRDEIFKRFRQGTGHRPGGSGVGLALVDEIVTQHGGSISISKARGGGALFRLQLALAPPGSATAAPPDIGAVIRSSRERLRSDLDRSAHAGHERSGEPDRRPRILLVEANPERGRRLADYLSARYAVCHVSSAELALHELERWPPKVLLTDVALPGMSGEALIEELRSRPERDHLPIVALSSGPDPALVERLLRAGAQDFVSEPFTEAELAARLDGLLARSAQELSADEKAALAEESFERAPLGVGLLDSDGRWLRANRALCALLGYNQRELRQVTLDELTAPEDVGVEQHHLADTLAGRTRGFQVEKRLRRPDGEYIWVLLSVAALPDRGRGPSLVVHVDDVSDLRVAEDSLRWRAVNDELTGLLCRREFERRMARHLRRARSSGALLLVDVDDFASLNRRHGRAAGDRVLRAVARTVRATAPRGALAGRVDGDRLGVLLTRTDHDAALEVAAALGDSVRRCGVSWRGASIRVSASVGGAMFDARGSVDATFATAEDALDAGKRDGGGGLVVRAEPPGVDPPGHLRRAERPGVHRGKRRPRGRPDVRTR